MWQRGYNRLAAHLAGLLPESENATLLELGCGRGQLTVPLALKLKGRLLAIDSSAENITELRKELKARNLQDRVTARVGVAEGLQLAPQSIDAALSNFFLGWLDKEKAKEVMNRLHIVLKKGGLMVHCDFLPFPETPAQAIAIEQGKEENNLNPSPRWWGPEEICEIIKWAGFADINVSYFDWNIKFDYEMAVGQLERWEARPEFIRAKEKDLKTHGMELPKSFIITARKVGR